MITYNQPVTQNNSEAESATLLPTEQSGKALPANKESRESQERDLVIPSKLSVASIHRRDLDQRIELLKNQSPAGVPKKMVRIKI